MQNLRNLMSYGYWRDILIGALLGLVLSCAAYQGEKLITPVLFEYQTMDVWFESDIPYVHDNMIARDSNHYRTRKHPLFSLIVNPVTTVVKKAFHLDSNTAMRAVIASVAFVWIFILFMLLRVMGCRRFDAVVFSLLAAISAGSMFWFVVPEAFSFGSVSILLALLIVALSQQRMIGETWFVLVNLLTISFTTTNWMAGVFATMMSKPYKRAFTIIIYAWGLATLLSALQKIVYPSSWLFLDPFSDGRETRNLFSPFAGGPILVALSLFYHSLIMPAVVGIFKNQQVDWSSMVTQYSAPGSGSAWGICAVVLWTILLAVGLWALFSVKTHFRLRAVLGLMLAGQLILHTVYGDETFLYALHFMAFLIPLAALGCLTRLRGVVLALAILLIPCVGINNVMQFQKVLNFLQANGGGRDRVKVQMHYRPTDPWPRGQGHVVWAIPSTQELNKSYYEPGGSFSPSVGSFGVSIWVVDHNGKLLATSDSIPLKNINQKFVNVAGQPISNILAETDYYQAVWSVVHPGRWVLTLNQKQTNQETHLMLVVRSVGPAGAPIDSLNWDHGKLSINNRWAVTVNPLPEHVYLGDETKKNWIRESSILPNWKGNQGWGYAKFQLPSGNSWSLTIDDPAFKADVGLKYENTQSSLKLSLPDQRFVDSLNAQVTQLMMGTVGLETRPADPMNYPLTWQRDSAYIIAALASAGQLDVAKQLSTYLAKNDFFGGFGADSDSPGLAIWALQEVAGRLQDQQFDQFLWPHIQRKAELIEKMLTTKETMYAFSEGPIVPKVEEKPYTSLALIAKPAADGLITGKTDHNFRILYVNAVSYRGLLDAATLADRVGHSELASRWRSEAQPLKQAWVTTFAKLKENDPHTYSVGLWPSTIANAAHDAFSANLEKRWKINRTDRGDFRYDLLWTYYALGEAHQWLALGNSDRTWKTLNWFWKNQVSPGLYSWWEGNKEENPSYKWEKYRGWVNSPVITPHYWTAAEMLLLQLDMLASLDTQSAEPTIMIGAGIPKEWLSSPLEVKGLSLPQRKVDWTWDGKEIRVTIHGQNAGIKLGSAFPAGTPVQVISDGQNAQ